MNARPTTTPPTNGGSAQDGEGNTWQSSILFTALLSQCQLIPQVDRNFAEHLKLRDDQRSIGLLSVDNDDATYTAIDEATKMADVEVVYARSFYAGAKHTSGKWSGEIMAILGGPDPAEVRAGLNAAVDYIRTQAIWYSANDDDSIAFFPHVISRTGPIFRRSATSRSVRRSPIWWPRRTKAWWPWMQPSKPRM